MTVYVSEYGATTLGVFMECAAAMSAADAVARSDTGDSLGWTLHSDGAFPVWVGSQSDGFEIGFVTECNVVGSA